MSKFSPVSKSNLLLGASISALIFTAAPALADGTNNPFARVANPAVAAAQAAAAQATQGSQATAASQRALAAFAQAAAIRRTMDTAQIAARATAAALQAAIPNGLTTGGLQTADGAAPGTPLWINANAPTQTQGADGRTEVTVEQTKAQAILNWKTFNVGQQTDVTFDQHGNSSWVALNRVTDPDANASKIAGSIKAPGTVLIMNRNGVIFKGTAQINTGSLIAAAGNITNEQFLNNGIYSAQAGGQYIPSITDALGDVKVDAGAQITTNAPTSVLQGGGYVMLLGGKVQNDGAITTPKGQTLLAAGDAFAVRPGYGTDANQYSTTKGSEVAPAIAIDSINGAVTNTGVITAQQGDITLTGRTVTQAGVAISTTSVNQRGTIHLLNSRGDTLGSVTLTQDSLTAVLPELDSKDTALDSQRDALVAASGYNGLAGGQFDNLSPVSDRKDQSRVEIVSGGHIDFAGGSYTLARGGQIAATATGRILTETGAWLDVSGVRDVALDAASNNVLVNVQGNELRDSPLNRDDPNKTLYSAAGDGLWVNINDLVYLPAGTGGYAADRYYTKGGLLEVSGYLGNVAHSIGEWTAVGGTITLQASEVVARSGSVFNLAGGTLDYAAGPIMESLLQGEDGKMYTANNAPADMHFVSVGASFQLLHPRWGDAYTETFQGAFVQKVVTTQEAAYTVGRDAGQLILAGPTVQFAGDIDTEVVQGIRQTTAHPAGASDGYKVGQANAAQEGRLAIGKLINDGTETEYATDVRIGASPSVPVGLVDAIPDAQHNTAWLDAGALTADHLGGLTIITGGSISIDAPLTLADGGQITLTAPSIAVNAGITAHGGHVTMGDITHAVLNPSNGTDIYWSVAGGPGAQVTVAPNTKIDLTGDWTNLLTDPDGQAGLAYIDGGSLRISTTGGITLGTGSLIDASSGGAILLDGSAKGGKGGDVYLVANDPSYIGVVSPTGAQAAALVLDGDIRSYGFTGGGTLTLGAGQTIVIGEDSNLAGGTLAAGTKTATSVRLDEAVTFAPGDTIPIAWDVTMDFAPLDAPITARYAPNFGTGVTTAAAWTLPSSMRVTTSTGQTYFGGANIPAGTILTAAYDSNGTPFLPVGIVLPSAVFASGFPITPVRLKSYAAGDTLTDTVTLPKGFLVAQDVTFDRAVKIEPVLTINPTLFQSGFSKYDITSATGMEITSAVAPVVPVYRFTGNSASAASDVDLAASAPLWTPPTYLEDPVKAQLTQRIGADLTLTSAYDFDMAAGSSITVDPGHAAALYVSRQTTIGGDITAPGGAITIDSPLPTLITQNNLGMGFFTPTRSVWIADGVTLDVAGRAVVATDQYGRRYGVAPDGGTITLGAPGNNDPYGYPAESNAFIVIRPDAVLDASGAGATIDLPTATAGQSRAVDIAGDGGTITLGSTSGIYLDGTLRAAAGGPNAAGGTLNMSLVSTLYIPTLPLSEQSTNIGVVPDDMRVLRAITLVQDHAPSDLAADARPGDALAFGQGTLGVDQLHAGGFDALSLYSRDAIVFNGDVNLSLGRNIAFAGANLGTSADTPDAHVTIAAPHVSVEGTYTNTTVQLPVPNYFPGISSGGRGAVNPSKDSSFTIDADLIDLTRDIGFGVNGIEGDGTIDATTPTQIAAPRDHVIDIRGFGNIVLNSRGDIRFGNGSLTAPDLTMQAAQIYPLSNATATVTVGAIFNGPQGAYDPDAAITIRGNGGAAPAVPTSLFGTLVLVAPTIDQGGVLRAPLGYIQFGSLFAFANPADSLLTFRAGSITSTSADGLVVPFGGTSDGISYAGGSMPLDPGTNLPVSLGSTIVGNGNNNHIPVGISVNTTKVVGETGSLLDVSGGGTLAGEGFLSGRGGSVDVLKTPLVNANPGNPGKASDKVYAILPGYASDYAPKITSNGAGDPMLGQQITLTAPAGGLAAGTYTLLPSSYAMLPGAARVELTGPTTLTGAPVARPDGTVVTSGILSTANTNIRDSLATGLIVSPGKTVRSYAQYNEENYSDFIRAQAAQFNALRQRLPEDGGILQLNLGAPTDNSVALDFAGSADFAATKGGYDGALLIGTSQSGSQIYIIAPDASAIAGNTSISSDSINAFKASTLMIGGGSQYTGSGSGGGARIALSGSIDINLLDGADVRAGEVFLVAPNIHIAGGATIDTRGLGSNGIDSRIGYLYGNTYDELQAPFGPAVVAIGNGDFNFLPPTGTGTIDIGSGATLTTEGAIVLAAAGSLTMGDVNFGAKRLTVAQNQINAGSDAALGAAQQAGVLQSGWTLNQQALDRLLRPSTTPGAPVLEELVLTAGNSISLFGNVALDASGRDATIVLNTPAIYGLGGSGDVASIKADTLYWNGIRTGSGGDPQNPADTYADKGAPPVLPNGAGTGTGTLIFDAKTVVFGYDPTRQPTDSVTLTRTALGFGAVNIAASEQISTNDDGILSVPGDLVLTTPLITASHGAAMAFTAGGAVTIKAPAGVTPTDPASNSDLGGTLSFKGASVALDTAVALPSGKLTLDAANDVTIGANARIDLDGRPVTFFDVTQYGWGGDLVLASENGSIRQAAGAVIDISAVGSDAGTISAAAANGVVTLDGTLKAQGAAGFAGGSIAITTQTLADLDGLNARLDDAGFFASRGFDVRQGDLVVNKTVKADSVTISADGGSLTINGTIDASGAKPGTIRLAAQGDLTLSGGALLDTHNTILQIDSYGQAVEASNTGHVELASTAGMVTLASGATIDMTAPDGVARGKLEIDAPRLGLGDVAVQAGSGLVIKGADSVAVNAFRTYDLVGGTAIDQAMLDGFDTDSRAFIDASYDTNGQLNGGLQTKLAGLLATGNAFHYRPGVELVSSGDLSTTNDLDLSGYRYGPGVDPAKLGSGESGKLVVRAAGNININGSVTDGFAPPPTSPDSNQWLIPVAGYVPTDYVYLSANVTLAEDWLIPSDGSYPYVYDTNFQDYYPGQIIPAGKTIDVVDFGFAWSPGNLIPDTYGPGAPRPVYALAAPLAAGSQSWSMTIVAGADTAAADVRALRTHASLNGSGNVVLSDLHNAEGGASFGYSVVRTGTGDLALLAGGNIDEQSPYGIYTAGTPIAATGTAANDPYNVGRGVFADGTLLGSNNPDYADYEAGLSDQRMYYVEHGGDVLVSAQGDIQGRPITNRSTQVGDWLLRQGGADDQATAWGISFGTYTANTFYSGPTLHLAGFSGIGTLGGGNVSLLAGGDIGSANGQGVVAAVGATGRVMADGSLAETGGGTLTVKAGGNIGAGGNQFVNLRGAANVATGDFGTSYVSLFGRSSLDPRQPDPLMPYGVVMVPGASFALGDGSIQVRARGDLAMGTVTNAGLASLAGLTDAGGLDQGATWFSLWKDHTSIDMFAAGGDLSPFGPANTTLYLPPVIRATAPGGNIYAWGDANGFDLQMPSPYGALDLFTNGSIISMYGNSPLGPLSSPLSAVATPFHPGWMTQQDAFGNWTISDTNYYGDPSALVDIQSYGAAYIDGGRGGTPFVFAPNNASDDSAAAVDGIFSHIYAVNGDILSLGYGQIYNGQSFANGQTIYHTNYQAAKPVDILAGRDIVSLKGVILHQDPNDVSMIAAGRDIFYAGSNYIFYNSNTRTVSMVSGLQIAGPGTLEVTAGQNLYQGSSASIESIGPIITGDARSGASVVLQAGVGAGAPGVGAVDWDGFAALYLDPANQIGMVQGQPLPLEGSGKVAKTYNDELFAWMKMQYGYAGTQADVLAAFQALPGAQQRVFLRTVYYTELTAAGREYNDPDSSRFASYLRGRNAIATLFPVTDGYAGNITMFTTKNGDITAGSQPLSGSVHTDFGGDIQLLTPGGGVTVGTEGLSPGAGAGLITQGAGNIDIYANDSVLLGLSRIMTTFGGDILAWSAEGDINAGRGAKTTVLFTPPRRTYDLYGRASLAPQVPSTGAGIATLAPIPEVPAGDIDLIAPLGTVDAGEAGIRVSGDINIAALHVVNAANIQVKGNATGLPQTVAVNTGALTAASSAATAVSQLANQMVRKPAPMNVPMIMTVQFIGFGAD